MVDTQGGGGGGGGAQPLKYLFRIDPSPNGIDRLPCEHSDIQLLDGQYNTGR